MYECGEAWEAADTLIDRLKLEALRTVNCAKYATKA
jgi:hypothetical protein